VTGCDTQPSMRNPEISSPTNERIKRLVRLRERTQRDEEGVFLVEGDRLIDRARAAGRAPEEIYVTPGHPHQDHPNSTIVEQAVLDKASYRHRSEGIIAVFAQFSIGLSQIELGETPLILIAESVEKPGNVGAMLRTADGAGCTALISTGSGTDVFNPNAIRASTGALFSVPYTHASLIELAQWLVDNKIALVVASPGAETDFWNTDMRGSLAILVGAEDHGPSGEAARLAGRTVAIPMSGISDSLNVSVSAALLVFEAKRQRAELSP